MATMRLQRFLARAGVASRRQAEELITSGKVRVDGKPAELGMSVDPAVARVTVGRKVIHLAERRWIAMHKPIGVVTTANDEQGRRTVLDLIPDVAGLTYVGRLDVATTGLLLLTTDGEAVHRLTHPKYRIPRRYIALVHGAATADLATRAAGLIKVDGRPVVPTRVQVKPGRDGRSIVEVTLAEGRNRIVRRWIEEMGAKVERLARVSYGPVRLGDLPAGKWRPLTPAGGRILSFPVERVVTEIRKRVVGQDLMIERLLIGLLTGGHVLLEGVPGLAKTLTVRTLADVLHASFSRIQFTPDLLPADVVGTMIYEAQRQQFAVRQGPIFAQIVLADEVNRAPAKVQSALLEAMQERQVTIGGTTYRLPEPFLVLATQNPIESEGTYPLPEAQLDRFLLKVRVNYPVRAEEREVLLRMSGSTDVVPVQRLAEPAQVLAAREQIVAVHLDPRLADYIVDLVRATREPAVIGLGALAPMIAYGASPRASIALAQTARARAYLHGREFVTPEDVQDLAPDVMRHRIVLTFDAEAEGIDSDAVIQQVLGAVPVP
jgi:MoxR-like ATPase